MRRKKVKSEGTVMPSTREGIDVPAPIVWNQVLMTVGMIRGVNLWENHLTRNLVEAQSIGRAIIILTTAIISIATTVPVRMRIGLGHSLLWRQI